MSIGDIIASATQGTWVQTESSGRQFLRRADTIPADWIGFGNSQDGADVRFIATFNPEHVALMEAVHIASLHYFDAYTFGTYPAEYATDAYRSAIQKLGTYREERGLL